jgi:S-adenosylmethionine synthetase
MGRHGGGAFSGKDPSKVDRSAAYMGRYVAKNIVASGLATRAEIQFAYAIGYPDPVSVCVDTFGTSRVSDEKIERAVTEVFNFKPAAIIKQLNLLRPIYSRTTNYGHFGKIDDLNSLTWEKTDKASALKKQPNKNSFYVIQTSSIPQTQGRRRRQRLQGQRPEPGRIRSQNHRHFRA